MWGTLQDVIVWFTYPHFTRKKGKAVSIDTEDIAYIQDNRNYGFGICGP